MRVLLSVSAQGQCAIVPKTPVRGNKSCGSIGMRIRHSKSDALRCCVSSEVFQLADAPVAAAVSTVLKPVLTIGSVLMIVRIVMTWYPEINENEFPWSIAYKPTESVLAATRKVIKPFNGLDVSPIVWVALLSFLSEILTGPQGILTLLQRKGIS